MAKCTVCGEATSNKCGKCGQVWYCRRECQVTDWNEHKKVCKYPESYEVKQSEGKGFGLFAKRDLNIGDLIIREDPIIRVTSDNRSAGIAFEPLAKFEDAFRKLNRATKLKLLALAGDRFGTMIEIENEEGDEFDRLRAYEIFLTNSIAVNFTSRGSRDSALYEIISRINHSCRPNAMYSFMMSNREAKAEVRALTKIAKGQEICITYIPATDDERVFRISKERRQAALMSLRNFVCQCELCLHGSLEEEEMRKRIEELNDEVAKIIPNGKFEKAAGLILTRIDLMERCPGLVQEVTIAYRDLYELLLEARRRSIHINYKRIKLSSNIDVYREKIVESAKPFKLDIMKVIYNEIMQKFSTKYGVEPNLWI